MNVTLTGTDVVAICQALQEAKENWPVGSIERNAMYEAWAKLSTLNVNVVSAEKS